MQERNWPMSQNNMQKPKIFGYILRLWRMVPKIHGTAGSIKTRMTEKSARTYSKVKTSNEVSIQQLNIGFKRQNEDRSTSYVYSHSSSSSSSFSTSDEYDDLHAQHIMIREDAGDPYIPPLTDYEDPIFHPYFSSRLDNYDDLYVPPLMKRNDAGDPYIRRPLVDYGDKKNHIFDDQKYAEDPIFHPYFPSRLDNYDDLYVPPLMKRNDAGDPYVRRPLVDYGDKKIHIFDDQKYAEQLQLEEALVFSSASRASTSSSSKLPVVSSKLPERYCNICMEKKTESEMFRNTNVCGHMFCFDCIREHVAVKIKENMVDVRCPDPSCKGLITPEVCRFIVPREVLIRWEKTLCESMILGSQKFYCPFKDCSALLVDDGGQRVMSSECPNCNRLFCAQCKVAWHAGMDCREFKMARNGEIDQTDILMTNLAMKKNWRRCPKCSIYVEKTEGCNHIYCRCGYEFCYACGMNCPKGHHEGPCQPARTVRPARTITPARRIGVAFGFF